MTDCENCNREGIIETKECFNKSGRGLTRLNDETWICNSCLTRASMKEINYSS